MKVFRGTKEIFFHSFRNEDDNDGDDDDSGGAMVRYLTTAEFVFSFGNM